MVGVADLVGGEMLRVRVDELLRLVRERPEDGEGEGDHPDHGKDGGRGAADQEREEPAHRPGGSSARRTPSETWLSETTVSRMARVGNTVCHGVFRVPS